ncbi:NAD-dependent epimerase/dehydratase family protein [uncultured Amnibacterium sp.]|uniref:NAD-dependent epimerase/dehydratase family protein n=1 Tax=uncultured Amnibacterium sp. TaxID=1631851 RepID=UPI0035CC6DFE
MARILVVGANGFIGSHLVDALAAAGHEVTAFDRYRSERPAFDVGGARVLAGDFLSRADLEQAVAGQDVVFHFLSTTTPATAEGDPTFDLRTNVAQSVELLQLCVAASVQHFYFASTGGAVYGDQGKAQYVEDDRALPVSPYAIGKLTIENYLSYFRATHGLQATVLRISNPYGGRQKTNRVQGLIPIALRRVAAGEPVIRLGDGSMVRDYLYVGDLVEMITRMVGRVHAHTTYNLGSGTGHTVNEVLDTVRRVTGVDFDVVDRPKPATFVDEVVLGIGRYTGEFGAFAFTGLEEGVRRAHVAIGEQLARTVASTSV